MPTLPELLKLTVELDGSDLHLSTKTPPQVRVHGDLRRLEFPELSPADTKTLAYSVLTDAQKKRFEETLELDFSFGIRDIARFRCNMFNQKGAVAAVYRQIPERVRAFDELGLPPVIAKLAERPRGLVLVTGPTGSGKSTTLAAMIDKINSERHGHILTIEDPIEYLHAHKKLPGQPARDPQRHAELHRGAACGAARRPGHRADWRDARPRNRRSRAEDRRDGPPDVRHAAHQLGSLDDQPDRGRVSRAPAVADPHAALAGARRASSVRRSCPRRTARAARWRWRFWCQRRASGT